MKHPSSLCDVTKVLVSTALGKEKADLVVRNSKLVNVYTRELLEGIDVAVKGDRIALVGNAAHTIGPNTAVVDATGKYLAPGFLDGHVHVESSMLTIAQFARIVLPRGTTGVFIDPHEIANVLGLDGVRMMLEESRGLPLRVFVCVPSCVPATSPEFETAGAEISPKEIEGALGWEGVVALGEMMNYPGVLAGDERMHLEIRAALKAGKVVEGHSNGLLDEELAAYTAAGITSCHESTREIEGLQRARLGMWVMVREGSAWRDLADVIRAYTARGIDGRRFVLVSDDRHPEDLLREGHVDHILRRAVKEGIDPLAAIQMVTLNTAEHFGLDGDLGGIAPGKLADMVLLSSLREFSVDVVIAGGRVVAKEGKLIVDLPRFRYPERARKTMNVRGRLTPRDLIVRAPLERGKVKARVIGVSEGKATTRHLVEELEAIEGEVLPSVEKDIAKVAVVERHKATGNVGLGFVKGFGLERGAVASTVAHDSHNLLAMGMDDSDMAFAANKLIEVGGGMIAVSGGKILALVELPIAGLMSEGDAERVSEEVAALKEAWAKLGCEMTSPFMTMSLLALPVLPELRITDKGLVDTVEFRRLSTLVE
ncbi:MAG: adenine deaminase [Hadesarchaea archaeon]|nr:adenine deaminase [Hadesarchaea archaeon]